MDPFVNKLLLDEYGLRIFHVTELSGYDNINYRVSTPEEDYILKQYRDTAGLPELIIAENKVLGRLADKNPGHFQEPVKTVHGKDFFIWDAGDGRIIFRLLKFIDGDLMSDVSHTPDLLYSLGVLLGKLDNTLLDYHDPVIEARRYDWDILHFELGYGKANHINDPSERKLVDYFFQQYQELIRPVLPSMRKSIIYGDANDRNIIVKDNTVAGLIDFGDMVFSLPVNDLAVAITYSIMGKEDPLQWAVPIIQGYCSIFPLQEEEIALLYYLVASRLCISVCKSAFARSAEPRNQYLFISEKPAWELLHQWIRISPVKACDEFRFAAGLPVPETKRTDHYLKQRWKHVSKSLSVSYREPIRMTRAAFQYMYDDCGRTFLDARNNVNHVGHCHPRVNAAAGRTMHTLNTNTRYVYDELNEYAARLTAKFPPALNKVFFVNSGSAASDLALRLALAHTAKQKFLVMEQGYHGNTSAVIDISHYKYSGRGGKGQAAHIILAPSPDTYRGPFRNDDGTAGKAYAEQLLQNIEQEKGRIAAFIAEPIIGCAGQIPLPEGYLNEIYPFIRKQGGVCISDEVQTGFGRLGRVFWGFELFDVIPDIVILGKPMGNGHPLAAVVTTDAVVASFENGMEFFSSFGGNPVSCSIGIAVLDVIKEEGLQENALETGTYLKNKLEQLKARHPCIGDVRGEGLFLGIELVLDKESREPATALTGKVSNALKEKLVMVGTDGPYENVLKIKPPLCFNRKNADELADALDAVMEEMAG